MKKSLQRDIRAIMKDLDQLRTRAARIAKNLESIETAGPAPRTTRKPKAKSAVPNLTL